MKNNCQLCGHKGSNLYDHIVCEDCKSKIGLFTDDTIKKHITRFNTTNDITYEEEVYSRLDALEKDYIKKRIKLLHIRERINSLK